MSNPSANRVQNPTSSHPLGIISLIAGVVCLVLSPLVVFLGAGVAMGIVSITCGVLSIIKESKRKRGFAIAGLVTSGVAFVLSVVSIIWILATIGG